MHYEEWSQTVKIFTMISLRNHHYDKTRCNDHLQILKLANVTESACSSQIVQPFLFIMKRLNSLAVLPIVTFLEKDFLG